MKFKHVLNLFIIGWVSILSIYFWVEGAKKFIKELKKAFKPKSKNTSNIKIKKKITSSNQKYILSGAKKQGE